MPGGGVFLNHCVAVRMRILGSGTLKTRVLSLDGESVVNLPDLPMSTTTQRFPNLLTNFTTQRYQVEISTENIDEYFSLNQLIIYNKTVATGYPQ